MRVASVPMIARGDASCLATAGIVLVFFFFAYHAMAAASAYGPHFQEYADRARFLTLPESHELGFLAGVAAESRTFLARGVYAPWLVGYVESLTVVRFFAQGGYLLGLSLMLLLLVAMVLAKCLLSERYAVDRMTGAMKQMRKLERYQTPADEQELLDAAVVARPRVRELLEHEK